jgi:hypothetical protein
MPSLERLAHVTARTPAIAAWTAAAGFVSGMVLNAVNRQRGLLETVPWTDPVVLRMAAVVAWLVTAAVVTRLTSRRADGPRPASWLSLVSFGVLTVSILLGIFGKTRHGAPPVQPVVSPAAVEATP